MKVCLLQRHVPFVIVPPNKLKQFAVGKGNAPKDAVFAAAIRDGSDAVDNNAADAWHLRRLGVFAYRPDLVAGQPEYRKRVLASIQWPTLEVTDVSA